MKKTNSIDNKDLNNLCDIIVCHFLNEGKRLNNSTISILADKIVEIFKEKRSTYYVSPISKRKSRHNKPEIARGKLIDKHRNKLTIIKKNLVAARSYTEEAKQVPEIPREAHDSQIWLKHNNDPQEEVMFHWKLSYPIRKIENSSLSEFFEQWPILKTQAAIDLIKHDFQQKFNQIEETTDINEKFETFFNYIYNKRKTHLKQSDEALHNLLEDHITTDSKNAIRLFLLSSLVPPRHRARTGKKTVLETVCVRSSRWSFFTSKDTR